MSGHSKWANIKHRKGKQDAQRAKIFTKYGKEIIVAAKQGGGDPDNNTRLKTIIQKARAANMPMDNITRVIQKATGELAGVNYEEITYEGYGPGGAAVIVEVMTDNRNRSAADIRLIFSKNGGNMGESGCVSWMFKRLGVVIINKEEEKRDFDEVMMLALEAGAEDIQEDEESFEITCVWEEFDKILANIKQAGLTPFSAEISMVPENEVKLEGEAAVKMLRLMDALEDHDDVQNVYANFDIDDEILNQ